jgi:uncharacterized phage protein (TIGR01671 family)
MRERKWRAWDTQEKKWFEPVYEAHQGKVFELLMMPSGDLIMRTAFGTVHESTFPGRFIVVFTTGLLDREGKEIYEGDIIRGPFRNGEHRKDLKKNEFNCSVYFYLGHFGFKPHGNVGDFRWFPYWNECVVIGNIYEHPELLSGRPIEGEGP